MEIANEQLNNIRKMSSESIFSLSLIFSVHLECTPTASQNCLFFFQKILEIRPALQIPLFLTVKMHSIVTQSLVVVVVSLALVFACALGWYGIFNIASKFWQCLASP
jgi:hypothetical protein